MHEVWGTWASCLSQGVDFEGVHHGASGKVEGKQAGPLFTLNFSIFHGSLMLRGDESAEAYLCWSEGDVEAAGQLCCVGLAACWRLLKLRGGRCWGSAGPSAVAPGHRCTNNLGSFIANVCGSIAGIPCWLELGTWVTWTEDGSAA